MGERTGVLMRANNACEQCRAPNGVMTARHADGASYMLDEGDVFSATTGEHLGVARGSEYDAEDFVIVRLTVTLLRPVGSEARYAALCQRCMPRRNAPARKAEAERLMGTLPGMETR